MKQVVPALDDTRGRGTLLSHVRENRRTPLRDPLSKWGYNRTVRMCKMEANR